MVRRRRSRIPSEDEEEEDVVVSAGLTPVFSAGRNQVEFTPFLKLAKEAAKQLKFRDYMVKNTAVSEAAIQAVMRYLTYCSWNRAAIKRAEMFKTVKEKLDESGEIERTSTVWVHSRAILAHAQQRLHDLFAFELLEVSATIVPIDLAAKGGDGDDASSSTAAAAAQAKQKKKKKQKQKTSGAGRAAHAAQPAMLVLVNSFDEEAVSLAAVDAQRDACDGTTEKSTGLIIATLAVIAIKGGRATANDVWSGLADLGVVKPGASWSAGKDESDLSAGGGASGEAESVVERKFLRRMLVSSETQGGILTKQGYLKYSRTARDDDGAVEWYFTAGPRAIAEVGWPNVLRFIEQCTGDKIAAEVRVKWLADLGVEVGEDDDDESEEEEDDEDESEEEESEEEESEEEESEEEVKPKRKRARAKPKSKAKPKSRAKPKPKPKGKGRKKPAAKRRKR